MTRKCKSNKPFLSSPSCFWSECFITATERKPEYGVLIMLLFAVTERHGKTQLKKETSCALSQSEVAGFIMTRTLWQKEQGATGHRASAVRKQSMNRKWGSAIKPPDPPCRDPLPPAMLLILKVPQASQCPSQLGAKHLNTQAAEGRSTCEL